MTRIGGISSLTVRMLGHLREIPWFKGCSDPVVGSNAMSCFVAMLVRF